VGQLGGGGGETARRQEVGGGVAAEGPAHQGAQRPVGARIADEHPAEQGLRVVGENELLVHAGHGVGVDDVEGAGGGGEGVAEGGDVHAGELELGGEIVAGEGRAPAEDPVADHLGHGEAGGDQAHALPL